MDSHAGKSFDQGMKALEDKALSGDEISKHKSSRDAWITVDGRVYDITNFLDIHPGGAEIIMEHLNEADAGKVMRGQARYVPDSHVHSKYAFRMLQKFLVGRVSEPQGDQDMLESSSRSNLGGNGYRVDLTKPLVFQVGQLGADYDKWVHDPIVCKEPPRFFESDLAESLTRTKWWMIPLVWGPLVIWLEVLALRDLSAPVLPPSMIAGAFIWTFIEYLLHRYLFHMKVSGKWTNTLHYFLHGFHHKHPMDGTRLVFPPAVTSIFLGIIWIVTEPLAKYVVGKPIKIAMFGGGLLMYVAYDLTHYFLHFGTPFNDVSHKMKLILGSSAVEILQRGGI